MADTQYELRYLPLFYEDLGQKVIYISETLYNEKANEIEISTEVDGINIFISDEYYLVAY